MMMLSLHIFKIWLIRTRDWNNKQNNHKIKLNNISKSNLNKDDDTSLLFIIKIKNKKQISAKYNFDSNYDHHIFEYLYIPHTQ